MEKRQLTGLISAGLALVLLSLAAFSTSWLIGTNYGVKSKVGLRSVDTCPEPDNCGSTSLSEWADSPYAPDGLSTYKTLATISFVLALATAAAMLALLAFVATRKKAIAWPVHPGSVGLLLSIALLFVGVATLALHPFKSAGWGTGPGFMLLAGGDVAALLAALMLGRSEEPSIDDWFE
jgi:hypothetical protein